MLTYQPFMQRPPFAAIGAPLPAFPQLSLGPQFSFAPTPASFALHARIPSLPAVSPQEKSPLALEPKSPELRKQLQKENEQSSSKPSQNSFSIASILGKDSGEKRSGSPLSSNGHNPAPYRTRESASPSTPLSAGSKPFYYFYPPPQAPTPFSFAAAPTCMEVELQRSSCCGLGRMSAPVAMISEIVRNAGKTAGDATLK